MKQKVVFLLIFLGLIISLPIITTKSLPFSPHIKDVFAVKPNPSSQTPVTDSPKQNSFSSFKMLDKSTNQVIEIQQKELLCGSVACEMSPSSEVEALKAQAVAAYTYFCNLKEKQKTKPSPELIGADFAVESAKYQYFATKEQLKEKWGGNFNFYYGNIESAVNSVLGQSLKSDGEFIEALYHSISSGSTENIVDVFGGAKSYLVPVASPYDKLALGYFSTKEITPDEFKSIIESNFNNITFCGDALNWIGEKNVTDSGMVKTIKIGTGEFTGREMRRIFDLRSANFDLVFNGEKFIFSVRGYGHGVGMSQYGAEQMAKHGADYKQILAWYYPGANLSFD